ncbi:MAG TPA: ADP-ribosylglycohydrolase family protein [Anaerolineae bacterium]|nr:ADP-ribosylglycohydrolase family protein [Anaerolineae bacterium]
MLGAIAGDIIGSIYEHHAIKRKEFSLFDPRCRFTDDSVLTIAVAQAILEDGNYRRWVRELGRRYPRAGYGGSFSDWLFADDPAPYNSWGNGAAMRVSAVGWAFGDVENVLREAGRTAEMTHNHPEGIKGAQATALAVFLARTGHSKAAMRAEVAERFGYDLARTVDGIRPRYRFDISCQGTVPEALICFFDATSYEDTVRNAVSLGGDSDTLACIAGGVAEAFYGPLPEEMRARVQACLTEELWQITERFCRRFAAGT